MNIWSVTDGSAGHRNQADGLAVALAKYCRGQIHHITAQPTKFSRLLPLKISAAIVNIDQLKLPKLPPNIIICCGSKSQATAYKLAKLFTAISICVQKPTTKVFDIIVAPEHDYHDNEIKNISPNKLFTTLGAIGKITSAITLSAEQTQLYHHFGTLPKPLIGILVGGSNKVYRIDSNALKNQLHTIAEQSGGTLLITPSRRTDSQTKQMLQNSFSSNHYVWDERSLNPYTTILKSADALAVTWDSVNMLSEACSLGKPVFALRLADKTPRQSSNKFNHLHKKLTAGGYMQIYNGSWNPKPSSILDETHKVAKLISQTIINKI